MAGKIEQKEIRIFVYGGVVQAIRVGSSVPADIKVSVADADGCEPDALEDNGYGEQCVFGFRSGTETQHKDDDGVVWL